MQRRLGNQQGVQPVAADRNAAFRATKCRDKGVNFICIGGDISGHEEIMERRARIAASCRNLNADRMFVFSCRHTGRAMNLDPLVVAIDGAP